MFVACGVQQQQYSGTTPGAVEKDIPQFRDLTFGQAPTSDMVTAAPDSGLPCYSRPSDDMSVGYGSLSSLKYCFYDNQLLVVIGETKGLNNSQALLQTLQEKYGAGEQSNEYIPRYMWGVGLFLSPLVIEFDQNMITSDSTVIYESTAVQKEMQAAQAKATSNAASQF